LRESFRAVDGFLGAHLDEFPLLWLLGPFSSEPLSFAPIKAGASAGKFTVEHQRGGPAMAFSAASIRNGRGSIGWLEYPDAFVAQSEPIALREPPAALELAFDAMVETMRERLVLHEMWQTDAWVGPETLALLKARAIQLPRFETNRVCALAPRGGVTRGTRRLPAPDPRAPLKIGHHPGAGGGLFVADTQLGRKATDVRYRASERSWTVTSGCRATDEDLVEMRDTGTEVPVPAWAKGEAAQGRPRLLAISRDGTLIAVNQSTGIVDPWATARGWRSSIRTIGRVWPRSIFCGAVHV